MQPLGPKEIALGIDRGVVGVDRSLCGGNRAPGAAPGATVSAPCLDGALREAVGLWLDESLLTGESLPIAKQRLGERILAGSLAASGRGWAEVKTIAAASELGRIGDSLKTVVPPPTRLQRRTRRLTGRRTLWGLGLCAALACIQGITGGNWPQALLAALALALAVLPNEIPVVLALFLALGALRLARLGVLARWPAAVESLGSATVLAVVKTGTRPENRMVVGPVPYQPLTHSTTLSL